MPFKKTTSQEIEAIVKEQGIESEYKETGLMFDLILEAKRIREDLGIHQNQIASNSGLTQQMISRIEQITNTPNLENFLKYLDAMGYTIKLEKKVQEDKEKKEVYAY